VAGFSNIDPNLLLNLLRTAMRQYGAFMETQIAIEDLVGADADSEVLEYVQELAPEYIDRPDSLTSEHATRLLWLLSMSPTDQTSA
jgi:hypothetical protein